MEAISFFETSVITKAEVVTPQNAAFFIVSAV
jgi:hypothetical protein